MPKDDDDGPRLLTRPFDGKRGPEATEWLEEFLDAADGKGDEDASWADTFQGLDRRAGLSAAQVKRRDQRDRQGYSAMIQSMTDKDLKAQMRDEAGKTAAGAYRIFMRECGEPIRGGTCRSKAREGVMLSESVRSVRRQT